MRTRSRLTQEFLQCDVSAGFSWGTGSYHYINDTSSVLLNSTKTMNDSVNPGFFRAQREGALMPVAPMDSIEVTRMGANASISATRPAGLDYFYSAVGLCGGTIDVGNTLLANVPVPSYPEKEVAMQEALARAQTDAWDTLTFMAEFEKTISSLATLRSRVDSHIDKVFRRATSRRHLFANLADAFADAWLEYRYSFRPLYYDMLDIEKAIRRYVEGVEAPLARGWETREGSPGSLTQSISVGGLAVDTSTRSMGYDDGSFIRSISGTASRSVRGRAAVGVQVTSRVSTQVDFAVTAWELVPFSFVLDWFISMGSMISAFSPFATGAFRYGTWSLFDVTTIRVDCSFLAAHPGVIVSSSNSGFYSVVQETKSRVLSSVTPTLAVDINLDIAKITDLVALWTSRNSGILRRLSQR